MNYRVVLCVLCAGLAVAGCGKKTPEAQQETPGVSDQAVEKVEAAAPEAPAAEEKTDAQGSEVADKQDGTAPEADAAPWPKRPDLLKDALCMKGNCKCGDGFCAKNAWCLKGECFCGYNPPWASEYQDGSETYEPDCSDLGIFLKSKDYGGFTCEWMDQSPHFACENSEGCKTRKGKSVDSDDFVTEGDGIKKISSMIEAPVLYDLCGIEASEKLRYDRSKFEAFANKLAMLREPEDCADVTDTDPFALSCVRSALAVDDRCEIRRNCDVWFVPENERDRYVCEFDAGLHPDPSLGGAFYYSMPVGIRCDHEDGCACANARIAKGQYCNDGEGAKHPQYKSAKLPKVDDADIIRPLKEHSFVEEYSGGLKWADYEKTLEVPKLKLQKLIDGDALGKKLSDKEKEDYFRACRIRESKKLSGGAEVSFITCESVDYKGDTDDSCCGDRGDSTACSGGFLALRASSDDSYRVYPIGKLPEVCCSGDDCAEEYSYFLGDVYASSFLDTKSLHVTIGRNYHEDSEAEWPEDGMFCSVETFGLRLEHYVFAGAKYRMVGKYPEYEFSKRVRHSNSEAHCGEYVHADVMQGKLTLKDDSWTYVSQPGHISLVLSDPEQLKENHERGRKAEENDEEGRFIVPDIVPEYKKYLQYARRNYVFDAEAFKDFYKAEDQRQETGNLNADMKAFQGIQLKASY
ncbi:MAG: hypothetical protein IJ268_00470 [Proteobacteria bacterium]|nr:hypothetical protein [Pseudomonadota bacterium]